MTTDLHIQQKQFRHIYLDCHMEKIFGFGHKYGWYARLMPDEITVEIKFDDIDNAILFILLYL